MKKYITLAAICTGCVSLANAASVTIDFDTVPTDAVGGFTTLLEGDGTPGSGLNIGTAGEGANGPGGPTDPGVANAPTQPYGNIYTTLGVGTGGITFSDPTTFLTLYDSDGEGGFDEDLEANFDSTDGTGGFSGGNGNSQGGFGNVLIHQTNSGGGQNNNVDLPNDEGGGGVLTISSSIPLVEFGFSYIDLDNGVVAASTITFTDTVNNESVEISFADLEDVSSSIFSNTGVDFGNDNANTIAPITLAQLQTENTALTQFNEITIDTAGSGGLAEFTVELVPEPSSSMLVALGALSFVLRRRR